MKGYLVTVVRTARRGRDGPGEALPRPVRNPVAMLDSTLPPAEPNDERAPLEAIRQDTGSTAAPPTDPPAHAPGHVRPLDDTLPWHARDLAQASIAPIANTVLARRREDRPSDTATPPPHTASAPVPGPSATVASSEPSGASPREQPWPAARAYARTEWKAAATLPVSRAAPGAPAQPVAALPDIHVTIGRIEVSADLAAPPPKAGPPRRQPVMSLAQYEAKRRGGSQ